MGMHRRGFIGLGSAAFAGLALSGCASGPFDSRRVARGYGPLVADPNNLFDLPRGFSYRVISSFGDTMDDGFRVPDLADGMGAFPLGGSRVALVRNHELRPENAKNGPFVRPAPAGLAAFDHGADGQPLPGGTTTIVYDSASGRVESQHLSLAGTIRNCAGGTTPWGSWLTCEEDVTRAGTNGIAQDHGWVFEVPASARGPVAPNPLRAMGRFNHEAACVDPGTGIVYMTEDRHDGLFYRFLPDARGALARGGRLQALCWRDGARPRDSRNWDRIDLVRGAWQDVRWIDLDGTDSPDDDLRDRGRAKGAVMFARGEGIHFGDGELYFCCTDGGAARLSQIMRYRPSRFEGTADENTEPAQLQLFVESADSAMLNFGDNITVAPHGHLIVCEDKEGDVVDNRLIGVTPTGAVYPFALLRTQTETAGVCFSPDGGTMFVNVYHPTRTLAITGPWRDFAA
jgi:secreted PhoX family phosphatase